MILPFKQYFDKAKTKPTYFREKILAGVDRVWVLDEENDRQGWQRSKYAVAANKEMNGIHPKITTIREGNRWKAGDLMHMAYGVRTKNYCQFNQGIPELERVKSVQKITIISPYEMVEDWIFIDGKPIQTAQYEQLAINDGFRDAIGFARWFRNGLTGQILHFKEGFRYD